jgi:hypothetical protein
MVTQIVERTEPILSFRFGEKITREELERYAAEMKDAIEKWGKIRVLMAFEQFPKMEPAALWEDLKFSAKHFNDIERIALVGEGNWESWYAKVANILPKTKVTSFDMDHMQAAWDWLHEA